MQANILEIYFSDIKSKRFAPLSIQEERELLRGWPCRSVKQELIEHNVRFAVDVAKKMAGTHLPLSDLIGYANLGLCDAVDRFDPARKLKFISYAVWWIRQQIFQALTTDRLIRLPANVQDDLIAIDKYVTVFMQAHERVPTADELERDLGISEHRLKTVNVANTVALSLDYEADDAISVGHDNVGDDNLVSQYDRAEVVDTQEVVHGLLEKRLDERERDIVRMYYGFTGDTFTLEEISGKYDLTRERIRQIKEVALRKLKHPQNRNLLAQLS